MTAPVRAPLLSCRGLSVAFGGGPFGGGERVKVIDDVSFDVYPGETLGIVGESGSGKTTLTRLLMGLLAPSSGQVLIGGTPLAQLGRQALARRMQPVFQDPYASLNPRKTLLEIIGLPLVVLGGLEAAHRRARVLEMMERVGLPRRLAHSYPSQLSGGQRQRVSIARGLVARPDILLLDEPTSALDVSVQAQILNLLQELKRDFALTYLFVSHNLAVVEHVADQVAVINRGRIVEYGPADQVFSAPRDAYTRRLLDAVLPVPGRIQDGQASAHGSVIADVAQRRH